MELRTLRYFLAVAQAKTISAAAEALHVTQPTLSRQMQELEEELGKTLFLRGKRSITLTEEGTFFRKRAQEVVSLLEKTTAELKAPDELLSGDIHIGGGETDAIRLIARAARRMRQDHPHVTFHIFSGNAEDVISGRTEKRNAPSSSFPAEQRSRREHNRRPASGRLCSESYLFRDNAPSRSRGFRRGVRR